MCRTRRWGRHANKAAFVIWEAENRDGGGGRRRSVALVELRLLRLGQCGCRLQPLCSLQTAGGRATAHQRAYPVDVDVALRTLTEMGVLSALVTSYRLCSLVTCVIRLPVGQSRCNLTNKN